MKSGTRHRIFGLCFFVEILILFAGSVSANKGFVNFSVWNRSLVYRHQAYGLPDSSETIFHLDFSQNLTNFGTITVWTDGLLSKGNGCFSRGLVTWTGLTAGALTFDIKGGDDYFMNTNLETRFMNLYHPYIYFRGGSAGFTSKAFDLAVCGGKIARLIGLLGATYDVVDQPFYGFKARGKIKEALILGGGIFHSENQKDMMDVLTAKKNDLILADSEITFAPGWKIAGEFRRSKAQDPALKNKEGNSFRFGPLIRRGRLDFEANYRFTGSRFQDLSPESLFFSDQKGIFSSLRYEASRAVTLFGIVDRSSDNVDHDPSRNVIKALSVTSGMSFYSASLFELTAQWEFDQRKSEGGYPGSVDYHSNGAYLQASKTMGNFFPYIRFRWQKTTDSLNPWVEGTMPTLFLGFRKNIAGGAYYWLEGELNQRFDSSRHEADRNINVRSGLSYPFSSKFDVYAELYYHRYGIRNPLQQIEAFLGLRITLFRDTTLTMDVRAVEPLRRAGQSSNYMFTVRLDRKFSWGAPPRILGRYGLADGPIGVGKIEGFVFEDRNGNGLMDTNEKGLADIPVRLEDGSIVTTNSDGRYRFSNVARGPHQIQIEDRSIPATFYILSSRQVNVLVEPRATQEVFFRMISGAALSGRIIEDKNRNGAIDPDEKGLADVLVLLNPLNKNKEEETAGTASIQNLILNTYTDSEGRYLFDNIPPGEYEFAVDEETLPKGAVMAVPLPVKINLEAGRKIEGADYLVTPRPLLMREYK